MHKVLRSMPNTLKRRALVLLCLLQRRPQTRGRKNTFVIDCFITRLTGICVARHALRVFLFCDSWCFSWKSLRLRAAATIINPVGTTGPLYCPRPTWAMPQGHHPHTHTPLCPKNCTTQRQKETHTHTQTPGFTLEDLEIPKQNVWVPELLA